MSVHNLMPPSHSPWQVVVQLEDGLVPLFLLLGDVVLHLVHVLGAVSTLCVAALVLLGLRGLTTRGSLAAHGAVSCLILRV